MSIIILYKITLSHYCGKFERRIEFKSRYQITKNERVKECVYHEIRFRQGNR